MATSNTPRPTKAERRQAAREEARALREAQARRDRRNRIILVSSLVAVIAVLAVAVTVIVGQGNRSALEDVAAPAGANDSGGIVVGAGGVGSATEGAPEVAVYSDFMCPFCGQFELTNGPMLEEMRVAGEVTLQYHMVAYLDRFSNGTEYSTRSAEAAAVVADEAPEQFLDFYTALYVNQPAENTPGLSDAEMADIAVGVGVPEDVAAGFADDRFDSWVAAATDQATQDLPRPATPTIVVDGTPFEGDWTDPENLRAAITG